MSWLLTTILDWLFGRIIAWWKERGEQKEADKETEDRNAAARKKLEDAKTKEERDEAAGTIFDNLNR